MQPTWKTTTWKAAAILWTLVILGLCWTPRTSLPRDEDRPFLAIHIPHLDKIIHGVLFFGFAALWTLAGGRFSRILAATLALAVVSELGQMTEFVGRDASVKDTLADAAGGLAGLLALRAARGAARRPDAPDLLTSS